MFVKIFCSIISNIFDFKIPSLQFSSTTIGWDPFVDSVLRPPRAQYEPADLGPDQFSFGDKIVCRKDLQVSITLVLIFFNSAERDLQIKNDRQQTLQCTHWIPTQVNNYAVVVYCHGNCGSRVDAEQHLEYLLPNDISLFAFDFSGRTFALVPTRRIFRSVLRAFGSLSAAPPCAAAALACASHHFLLSW